MVEQPSFVRHGVYTEGGTTRGAGRQVLGQGSAGAGKGVREQAQLKLLAAKGTVN